MAVRALEMNSKEDASLEFIEAVPHRKQQGTLINKLPQKEGYEK
jgi:hypothetical protein